MTSQTTCCVAVSVSEFDLSLAISVPVNIDFVATEHGVLKYWDEIKVPRTTTITTQHRHNTNAHSNTIRNNTHCILFEGVRNVTGTVKGQTRWGLATVLANHPNL